MSELEVIQAMQCIPNPFPVPMYIAKTWHGFEIWKSTVSKKGCIYFRYTDFGRPKFSVTGFEGEIIRWSFIQTPFTSVKAFQDFITRCVVGY